MSKKDICSYNYDELKEEMLVIGEKAFRSKQIYEWLHVKLADDFDEMTNLSKALREKLKKNYEIRKVKMIDHQISKEDPTEVLKRELRTLTVSNYMRTVKDIKYPKRSEMREFGKTYDGTEDVYIKVRIEMLDQNSFGKHTVFIMSFHFAVKAFKPEDFPYRKR